MGQFLIECPILKCQMTKLNSMNQIIKIAEDYFDYMARNYPVMCSCDEFYFFPRARKATAFLNVLDSLDEQKIKQDIAHVKNLKSSLDKFNSKDMNLEARIDVTVLNQSMSTFLREFEEIKIWQIDPNLYLKVLLFGIDQILARFSFIKANVADILLVRIAQIPRILDEARRNLKKVPQAYLEVAGEMVEASIGYLRTIPFSLKNKHVLLKKINALNKKNIESLKDFKRFLKRRVPHEIFIKDKQLLENILKDSFSYKRSLEEIFDIASEEYRTTLKELAQIAKKVNPRESWQQILSAYRIEIKDLKELLELYPRQIKRIRNFLKEKDIVTIPRSQNILVRPTPKFMQPIRASASYSCPITYDKREPAYFYLTADFAKSNAHNEYIFVTAHETYPGHHLLDSIRRGLKNPIRQQIESPLFYEGWASYAERLIDQLGYVKNPRQRLVGLKRQAWRAVRAMLDVGTRINRLKLEDGAGLLRDLGYDPRIVKLMLRHYLLTPGYQACYTIGRYEIGMLDKKFSSKLGLKKFHDFILQSGQIPFHLIEKRMESIAKSSE